MTKLRKNNELKCFLKDCGKWVKSTFIVVLFVLLKIVKSSQTIKILITDNVLSSVLQHKIIFYIIIL